MSSLRPMGGAAGLGVDGMSTYFSPYTNAADILCEAWKVLHLLRYEEVLSYLLVLSCLDP